MDEVLKRLRKVGVTVDPDKAQFAREQLSFLRHFASAKEIKIDPERTQRIRVYSSYRFSELSATLNPLRKKDKNSVWGGEQESSF